MLFKTMNFLRRFYLIKSHYTNFKSLKQLHKFGGPKDMLNIRQLAELDKFIENRKMAKLNIRGPTEYLKNLALVSNVDNDALIFFEDIKNVVTLAETDEDILLLEKVLLKFSIQKNVMHFQFNFGPQVMRLLYIQNKPCKALELVQNPNLIGYFKHGVTILLLMNLLFINDMHHSVIEIYEAVEKPVKQKYSNYINFYFFAACYKLNTEKSLVKARSAWYSKVARDGSSSLRIRLVLSMLLLNQNECPLDLILWSPENFVSLRENIKYMVLAKGKRFQDAFSALEFLLNSEQVDKFLMSQEAISFIEKQVQESAAENIVRFFKIKQKLTEKNLITDEPLDTFLLGDLHMGKDSCSDALVWKKDQIT